MERKRLTRKQVTEIQQVAPQAIDQINAQAARIATLEAALRDFINAVPDVALEWAHDVWGESNTRIARESRDRAAAALKG